MSTESAFSLTGKAGPNNSILVTLRGDSYDELVANGQLAGVDAATVASFYATAFSGSPAAVTAQAVQNVVTAMPGTVPLPQPGAALPQPGAVAAPAASVPPPPTAGYPGDCVHGTRRFKSLTTARGPWSFWECAKPWDKNTPKESYCAKVNA